MASPFSYFDIISSFFYIYLTFIGFQIKCSPALLTAGRTTLIFLGPLDPRILDCYIYLTYSTIPSSSRVFIAFAPLRLGFRPVSYIENLVPRKFDRTLPR